MVIPGVNGSVLASAYQQSKLRRRFNQGGPVKPYANLWAVSPQGDFNYQAGLNTGPFSARVTGSTNVPNLRQNFLEPSLSMNAGPANVGFTPRGVSAGIGGGNAYLQGSADYSGETASLQGGVFGQKFGVNADAFLDRSKYIDAGVTASYNLAPGLSVEGSYRYNNFEGPSQDYFLGARYSKKFKEGGRRETSTAENPERMEPIYITPKTFWEQRMRSKDSPQAIRKPERNYQDNLRTTYQPTYQALEQSNANRKRQREIQEEIDTQIYNDPDRSKLSNTDLFLDRFSSPFSYIDYKTSGRPLDDYTKLERTSPLDYALDLRNPITVLNAAYNTGSSLVDGNYLDAVLNAFDAVPAAIPPLAKSIKRYPELHGMVPKMPVNKGDYNSWFGSSGQDFMKRWHEHPDFAKRYNNYASIKSDPFGADVQRQSLDLLNEYRPKTYQDLLSDKGVQDYKRVKNMSSGVSYGTSDGIYVDDSHIWGRTDYDADPLTHRKYYDYTLAQTEAHELSHLTDNNGANLTQKEIEAINEAVPFVESDGMTGSFTTGGPEYFTKPTEVRARMMEARQEWGMTPDQEFTPEMYDWVMDEHNWYGMGPHIKDKDKFINLMNTMRAVPAIGAAGYGASQITQQKLGGRLQQAYMKSGGKHGGLDRWFAEKWVDVKSGKPCGRQEGEDRAYPACRPSRRVSSQTPKTSSEMSSQEKAKFKSAKTSSERIPYNHKRK